MNEIQLFKSRKKTGWLIVLCLVLMAITTLALVLQWIPAWGFGLLIAGLILGLFTNSMQYLDQRPYITLNEEGIYAPHSWPEIIPWTLIKAVDIRSYPNFQLLNLELYDSIPKKMDDRGELTRHAIRINSEFGTRDVTVILTNMDISKKELLRQIRTRLQQ